VKDGALQTLDARKLVKRHNRLAAQLMNG
jgi:hypothetical protein